MTGGSASEPAAVVHGAANAAEVAAVHAAISRRVSPRGGPLADLARWRERRLEALANTRARR
jgi:hypothetical protein